MDLDFTIRNEVDSIAEANTPTSYGRGYGNIDFVNKPPAQGDPSLASLLGQQQTYNHNIAQSVITGFQKTYFLSTVKWISLIAVLAIVVYLLTTNK